ncbi:MAG: hypothetical protein ACRCUP_07185 [Mycoplasmatales bacterium]
MKIFTDLLPNDQIRIFKTRDVSSVGHWGTGNTEIVIEKNSDIEEMVKRLK